MLGAAEHQIFTADWHKVVQHRCFCNCDTLGKFSVFQLQWLPDSHFHLHGVVSALNTLACNVNHVLTCMAQKPVKAPLSAPVPLTSLGLFPHFYFLSSKDLKNGENRDSRNLLGLEMWERVGQVLPVWQRIVCSLLCAGCARAFGKKCDDALCNWMNNLQGKI